MEGLNEAGEDLEAVSKFLDANSSKLDYRRYGGNLIEILIAGGLLGMADYLFELEHVHVFPVWLSEFALLFLPNSRS